MNEIEKAIKVLEEEYKKIKFKEPWYMDALVEAYTQLVIFDNIDMEKIRDIIEEKMLVRP